jgi:hypothetical protein
MFSPTSGASQSPTLIPAGTLAFANVMITDLKKSQASGGEYANIELTLHGGDFEGRKVFEMVANPLDNNNSEAWRGMAIANLTRMFEAAGVFRVDQPETYNQFNGKPFTAICTALDGVRIAIKIKVEKDKSGAYPDKNKVGEFLSPNPQSGGHKSWEKLISGNAAEVAAARPSAFGAVKAPAPVASAPSWLNAPKA